MPSRKHYLSAHVASIIPVAIAAYMIINILSGGADDPPIVAYLELVVLAIGLVLAVAGRFRMRGMSRAMGAVAIGQLVIGAVIAFMGLGTTGMAFTVSVILAGMFGGAAWAFAQIAP